jgi:hypothetical protein
MEDKRVIERFNALTDDWKEIPFNTLMVGDIFRIFDNGERYVDKSNGNNVWIATSEPYLNEDSIWTIQTLY